MAVLFFLTTSLLKTVWFLVFRIVMGIFKVIFCLFGCSVILWIFGCNPFFKFWYLGIFSITGVFVKFFDGDMFDDYESRHPPGPPMF